MKAFRTYLAVSLGMFVLLGVGKILGFVESLSIVGMFTMSFLWPLTLLCGLCFGVLFAIGDAGIICRTVIFQRECK